MEEAFLSLLQSLKTLCKDVDVSKLQEFCATDMGLTFSLKFKKEIQNTSTSACLISLLNGNGFLTCLELRHFTKLAEELGVPEVVEAINQFKSNQHKRKVCEFNELLNVNHNYPDDCVLMTVKLNLQSQSTSIQDLINCCKKLEKIASLPEGSYTLKSFKVNQGIDIILIISSDCYPHAYSRTKDNYIDLRHLHIRHVEFGNFHSEKIFANDLAMIKTSLLQLEETSSSFGDTCTYVNVYVCMLVCMYIMWYCI